MHNFLLRGQILKNTDYCIGVVLFVGAETKVLQNMVNPRTKQSWLLMRMNRFITLLFIFYFLLIVGLWLADIVTSR